MKDGRCEEMTDLDFDVLGAFLRLTPEYRKSGHQQSHEMLKVGLLVPLINRYRLMPKGRSRNDGATLCRGSPHTWCSFWR